jgi:hypothetical protein
MGFEIAHRQTHRNLAQQNSTYFSILLFLLLIIASLAGYSYWRYISTSTLIGSMQQHLPVHAGEIHYSRIPK